MLPTATRSEPRSLDADFVDIRGTHHAGGRPAIAAGHQVILDTIYKGTAIHYEVTRARLLDAGTLLAHANARLDPPPPDAEAATCSIVAAASGAEWEIASFHNTLVSA